MADGDRAFYFAWVVANAWTEALGLSATLLIGGMLAPQFEGAGASTVLLGAALAVILGACLEGVVVGYAQARVLARRLPALVPSRWIFATAIGAALAWLLGMVPSTTLALLDTGDAAAGSAQPPALMQYALGAALGVAAGPILGIAQWRVLREHAPRAWRWIIANALAWAAGMVLLFVGMDRVPWHADAPWIAVSVIAVCAVAGAVVGAIHGRWLLALLPRGDRGRRRPGQ